MTIPLPVDEGESINMTPMIDVVFNLLIFFLLGSTYMNDQKQLELELPTVSTALPASEAPDEIAVEIRGDGQVTVRGEPVSLPQLEDRLKAARANYPDQAVAVRGDRNVRYEAVAQVIASCRRAGITRLDCLVQEQ